MKNISRIMMLFLVFSCTTNKTVKFSYSDCRNTNQQNNCFESMNTIKQLPKKEIDAVNTVINFYLWYCINTKLLNQNDLVAFDNTLGYYILDSKHAESYLRILKNSGYVSEFFLETISDKFEEFNNYLNKQKFPKEEEMVGFEADLLLNSQDPDYNVKQEEVEVAEIQVLKESITIRFYAPTIKSELILGENDKWMIKNFTGY